MNIAFGFDIFYPERNGVITATENLADNLIKMGHNVYFFVPKDKDFNKDTIGSGIHIIRINAVQSWIYKGIKLLPIHNKSIRKNLEKYKIDIVHTTSPWLMGMALNNAARRLYIPTIATHHTLIDDPTYIKYALKSRNLSYAAQNAIWSIIFRPFFKLTWMITTPSIHTCNNVKQKLKKDIEIKYISNGIDIDKFLTKEETFDISKKIPSEYITRNTFLFIGRLGFEKSIDITIKGFENFQRANSDAKLLIIGDGPAREQLELIIKENKLENKIFMAGLIPNEEIIGSKILSKVCSFVTASLSENQAMTVIEALCSGCPVICADVDNMTCLVRPDQGWYFKPNDIADLSAKMSDALENKRKRDMKAENALLSLPRFDGRLVSREFVKTYEKLLEMKKNKYYVPGGKRFVK